MLCPITDGPNPPFFSCFLIFGCNAVKLFPRIHHWTAAHQGATLWLTPDRCATKQTCSPSDLQATIESSRPNTRRIKKGVYWNTDAHFTCDFLQYYDEAISSPRGREDRSGIKLRQSTNRSCLSHLPARGGCVCACACMKSLGISPSSRRPFKCMRQYHTIVAGGGARCKWTIRIKK